MRVPHTIPVHTLRVYAASDQTLALQAERYRTIRAEDLSWDDVVPLSLVTISIQVLAANFKEHFEVIPYLLPQDFDYFLEILSVDLPIDLVAPIIQESIYWKRCCISKWPNRPMDSSKHGDSWKRMYIERYCEEYIEYQEPGYIDWKDVNRVITFCASYVFRIELKELKPPRSWGPEPQPPDTCVRGKLDPDHIDLKPVLDMLVNLTEFSIRYGVLDCGMSYNPECFRISIKDVTSLGEGLKSVQYLSIVRVHRCAIDDIRVNILIEALMSCASLETLEISHCKFGDIGAKSLGKLMIEHNNLKSLLIPNNKIGPEGAEGLAYALQHENCCPIEHFNIAFNIIGDEGGIDFSTSIAKNKTLKILNLGGIGITSQAAIKIAEAILISGSLQKVYISNNHLGMEANESLIAAIQNNRKLETFDIRNCDIGELAETTIHKFIVRNRFNFRPR